MRERPGLLESSKEEGIDLESQIRTLYRLIAEIDVAGESRMTASIKRYIEQSLDASYAIKPTRIYYLQKLVNRIYADFLELQGQKLAEQSIEKKPEERTFLVFMYDDYGPDRGILGSIEMMRISETEWETSELGGSYNTTAKDLPPWLEIKNLGNRELIESSGLWIEEGYPGHRLDRSDGTVMGLPCKIYSRIRSHENGVNYSYKFVFQTAAQATQFVIEANRRGGETRDKKVRSLLFWNERKGEIKFDWSRLHFVDPHYKFLTKLLGFHWYSGKTIPEIFGQEGFTLKTNAFYDLKDIQNAIQDILFDLNERVYGLVGEIRSTMKVHEGESERDFNIRLREACRRVLTFDFINQIACDYKSLLFEAFKKRGWLSNKT